MQRQALQWEDDEMLLQFSAPPCPKLPPFPFLPPLRTHFFPCRCSPALAGSEFSSAASLVTPPAVVKKRKRYRKQYPGESRGIVEEMRFVAMRLRPNPIETDDREEWPPSAEEVEEETWRPSMDGFVKYLVDSRLVFSTLERIVEETEDVAYAYFRKTGLERTQGLSMDLEWVGQQGFAIPEPGSPGRAYAKYLEDVSESSAPSFLCHFYNIYFSHIAGGQVIARQVSEKLLDGKEFMFNQWEGNAQELLRRVRNNLNKLGEHWSRDEKNRCLREAAKSFRMSGQIVRLIIL